MPFNEHEVLKYLYWHNTAEFLSINEILKRDFREGDELEIRARIEYLSKTFIDLIQVNPQSDDYNNPLHFFNFGKEINGVKNTLDNFPIKARITPDGRIYYQRIFLSKDNAIDQSELSKSILSTNTFIKLTFVAISIGVIFQLLAFIQESKKEEKEERALKYQQEHPSSPIIKIYLSDTLQKHGNIK